MKWFFHPLAEQEFVQAVEYYEDCLAGLGMDFAREIHVAIHRIIQYPGAWSQISANTRDAWSPGFLSVSSTRSKRMLLLSLRSQTCAAALSIGRKDEFCRVQSTHHSLSFLFFNL